MAAKASARSHAPAYAWPRPGKRNERKAAANEERAVGRGSSCAWGWLAMSGREDTVECRTVSGRASGGGPAGSVGRPARRVDAPRTAVGRLPDSDPRPGRGGRGRVPRRLDGHGTASRPSGAGRRPFVRGEMFAPVPSQARPRRPGARPPRVLARPPDLRAAARPERGGPALELPRRADHRQQPDGRPPRLGPHATRTSSSAIHAMRGEDQRWQNGFDCQGLWVEVEVESELGFTSKRDIEDYGIAEFVSLCKQRVLHVRRPPDRAVDPPRLLDGLGRPRRAAAPPGPARGGSGARSSPSRARTAPSRTPSR